MNIIDQLKERAQNKCELTGAEHDLIIYNVAPYDSPSLEHSILVTEKCVAQINKKEELDSAFWQELPTTMWSEFAPVQVVAWRMLHRLKNEAWANDALDMLYLDDDNLAWAKQTGDHENDGTVLLHKDVNGNILQAGDSIVLTKSLDVKGSTLNAKMGTVVKNIRLVQDNVEQIEGKIEGQVIVILTKYVRKKEGA